MDELTPDQQLAALEGWAANPAASVAERLAAALQVIEGLRAREDERVRTAVVATLRYVRVSWSIGGADGDFRVRADFLEEAEQLTRNWTIEGGWCCPFCEEVTCDDDCPLAPMRGALE